MVITCCIKGCKSESYRGCGFSFYGFPKDEVMLQKWLDVIPVTGSTKYKKVCSNHFKGPDFHVSGNRIRLTLDAVPSVLLSSSVNMNPEKTNIQNIQMQPIRAEKRRCVFLEVIDKSAKPEDSKKIRITKKIKNIES